MVGVIGARNAFIEKTEVTALLDDFKRVGFFELPDRVGMDGAPFDAPTAELAVRTPHGAKIVRFHYFGDRPKELLYLMTRIRTLTNAAQWLCPRPYWPTPNC
jgi:hypothetical protein